MVSRNNMKEKVKITIEKKKGSMIGHLFLKNI